MREQNTVDSGWRVENGKNSKASYQSPITHHQSRVSERAEAHPGNSNASRKALEHMPYYNEMLARYFDHGPAAMKYEAWLEVMEVFESKELPEETLETVNKAKADVAKLTDLEIANEADGYLRLWYERLLGDKPYPYPLNEEGWHHFLWAAVEDGMIDRLTFLAPSSADFNQKLDAFPEPNERGYLIAREFLVILRYMKNISPLPVAGSVAPAPSASKEAVLPVPADAKNAALVRSKERKTEARSIPSTWTELKETEGQAVTRKRTGTFSGSARSKARQTPGTVLGERRTVPETVRSEARAEQVYTGVLDTVLRQKSPAEGLVRDLTRMARAEMRKTVEGLREAFDQWAPVAFAEEKVPGNASLAAGFQSLDQVLRDKNMTREALDRIAEQFFEKEIGRLAEAIQKREIGGIAPVIFYSPEMKARLLSFIETVQKSFEATGDVMAENYRITLVSENRAELLEFKTELSKRGALRGVSFEGNGKSLENDVFLNARFKDRFGIFFPEGGLVGNAPWQRVVRSEIPKEYATLLLPALSRYFSSVSTSDINGTTLRHALPDLYASARFQVGQGIAIVAAFLERIAAAERQFGVSA
jgi:hypothetical protein